MKNLGTMFLVSCILGLALLAATPGLTCAQALPTPMTLGPTLESASIEPFHPALEHASIGRSPPSTQSKHASGPQVSNVTAAARAKSRGDVVLIYAVAGAVVGALVGYVEYQRAGKDRPCENDMLSFCGQFGYMITGAGIGWPVGAVIGFLRTRR